MEICHFRSDREGDCDLVLPQTLFQVSCLKCFGARVEVVWSKHALL